MRPTYDNLARIRAEDIRGLVDAGVAEDDSIDFKRDWYTNGEDFRVDISALANSAGGCLVIGIDEENGEASKICGVNGDAEEKLLRMSNWAESGIRPRLQWNHQVIDMGEDGQVVLIGVRRSLRGPHMVIPKERFWKRLPVGANQVMDVDDLRRAFQYSVSEEDEVRLLLDAMLAGTSPVQQNETALSLVLAPSPLATGHFSPSDDQSSPTLNLLCQAASWYLQDYEFMQITFDGFSLAKPSRPDVFEMSWDGVLSAHSRISDPDDETHRLYHAWPDLIEPLNGALVNMRDLYQASGVSAPVRAICAVHGCEGRQLATSFPGALVSNRSDLFLDVAWLDFDSPWFDQVVPWLDRVWNAFGLKNCPIREENGTVKIERMRPYFS